MIESDAPFIREVMLSRENLTLITGLCWVWLRLPPPPPPFPCPPDLTCRLSLSCPSPHLDTCVTITRIVLSSSFLQPRGEGNAADKDGAGRSRSFHVHGAGGSGFGSWARRQRNRGPVVLRGPDPQNAARIEGHLSGVFGHIPVALISTGKFTSTKADAFPCPPVGFWLILLSTSPECRIITRLVLEL